MNRLLVILGVVSILAGGLVVLESAGFFSLGEFSVGERLSPVVLSVLILALGFIRFNKRIGLVVLIVGAVALVSETGALPFRIIPEWVLPWILIALGGRFLVIGLLSRENLA